MRIIGALAVSLLGACSSRETKVLGPEAAYRFNIGVPLVYTVESCLRAEMVGTSPLTWSLSGEFENVVFEVRADGSAGLERRVRRLKSSGEVNETNFDFEWESSKGLLRSHPSDFVMNSYAEALIGSPKSQWVHPEGFSEPEDQGQGRLVLRQGMMMWPVRLEETTWESNEEIVFPFLHEKLRLEFRNTLARNGSIATVRAHVARVDKAGFTVSGEVTAEFDMILGRLKALIMNLVIRFERGDVHGVMSYREKQTCAN